MYNLEYIYGESATRILHARELDDCCFDSSIKYILYSN